MSFARHGGAWLCLLFAAAGAAAEGPEPYAWPLELPRILTSSFGEYRSGRFHAGIDLRTGPPGQPVYAAEDGHVARLRCSPWGYGKALYLALADGRTAVYAHLDGFIPEYETFVRAAQHRERSYTVDVQPEPGKFAVRRGQLVAYAGETGTGVPHLHYELRDPAQHPLNPGPLGVDWPDAVPPAIRAVAFVPLDAESRVDADYRPFVAHARHQGPGRYTTRPVRVKGRLGLAIDCIDPANGGATRLGIYEAEVWAGDERTGVVRFDSLSYATMRHGAAVWLSHFKEEGRFMALWRWPGNDAPPYAAAGEGLVLNPGMERVEIRIRDFAGNTARLDIPLEHAEGLPIEPAGVAPPEHRGTVSVQFTGSALLVTAWFPGHEPIDPTTAGGEKLFRAGQRTFRWVRDAAGIRGNRGGVTVVHPRLDAAPIEFGVFRRGEAAQEVRLGEVVVRAQRQSPYGVLFVWTQTPARPQTAHFEAIGPAYRVEPASAAIDEAVQLGFPALDGGLPRGASVYRQSGGGWTRCKTREEGGRLWIETRSLGTFAALLDRTPPSAQWIAPEEGAAVGLRPALALRVADAASGVSAFELTANGEWLLASYDPETGKVEWLRDEDLPAGRVELRLYVRDEAGNERMVAREIEVRPASQPEKPGRNGVQSP